VIISEQYLPQNIQGGMPYWVSVMEPSFEVDIETEQET